LINLLKLSLIDPAGKYYGTTTVLGQQVTMTIIQESSSTTQIIATGPISVNCDKEAYSYSNGVITLPNASKPGDCVYEALNPNKCSIVSILFSESANEITVKIKYSILTFSVVCKHVASEDSLTALIPRRISSEVSVVPTIGELVDRYFVIFSLQDPAGKYEGTKTILGEKVTADVDFNAGSTLNFQITGPLTISCTNEAYTYANGVISITNVGKAGDCVHDALANNKATLKSIDYDTSSDVVTISLKISLFAVEFPLTHQSN